MIYKDVVRKKSVPIWTFILSAPLVLFAGALLLLPSFSSAEMIVNGECDFFDQNREFMEAYDDNVWGLGYCLALEGVEHTVLEDAIIREPTRYFIVAFENTNEARAYFIEQKRGAIEEKTSIGGGGWQKIAPEDVTVGETGFLEIAKNSTRYIGSEAVKTNTDNPQDGYYDQYIFETTFLQGSCVVDFLRVTNNLTDALGENHYEQYYRTPDGELRYTLINTHPATDHTLKEETKMILLGVAQRIANYIAAQCGGVATIPSTPVEEPYDYYKAIKEILDAVPLPEIPENVSYEQCGQLCSNLKTGYHSQLVRQCDAYEAEFRKHGYGISACESSAYQRMSACWSDSCGLTKILPGSTDGSSWNAILRPEDIEKTTKIPLSELTERQPRISQYTKQNTQSVEEVLSEDRHIRTGAKYGFQTDLGRRVKLYIEPDSDMEIKIRKDSSKSEGMDQIRLQQEARETLDEIKNLLKGVDTDRTGSELQDRPQFAAPVVWQGEVEVHIDNTEFADGFQINVPMGMVTAVGTHFWVQVTDEGHTIVGVYEGEVKLTSLVTGETQTFGTNSEKPAIAGIRFIPSEELGFVPEREQKGSMLLWFLIIAALGGGGFILYKTGKFQRRSDAEA